MYLLACGGNTCVGTYVLVKTYTHQWSVRGNKEVWLIDCSSNQTLHTPSAAHTCVGRYVCTCENIYASVVTRKCGSLIAHPTKHCPNICNMCFSPPHPPSLLPHPPSLTPATPPPPPPPSPLPTCSLPHPSRLVTGQHLWSY